MLKIWQNPINPSIKKSRNLISIPTETLALALSHRMGEGMAMVCHGLAVGCPAYAVAGFQ
jgi:hypothetical protein